MEDEKTSDDKKEFYRNILRCIEKFGYQRLYSLASEKRKRIFAKYRKREAIHFESLTFGARSRKINFIEYNSNFKSVINAFIELSWKSKTIYIPVKYSKKYFGDIKRFNEKHSNFQYEVTFDEKNKEIFVHICVDGKRCNFDARKCKSYIAADRNIKHNMFTLSSGIKVKNETVQTLDYERDLIDEYKKLLKLIKKYNENDPNYKNGKQVRIKSQTLKNKMKGSLERTISFMMEAIKANGYNHLVLEELGGTYSKMYATDEDGINYNKLLGFVKFFSLDETIKRIAHKHGVAVSYVPAAYTSQACPVCGHVHKNNRTTQEEFECTECGYKSNADINSAINILRRVVIDVLCLHLLKQNDNGEYEPKRFKRETMK